MRCPYCNGETPHIEPEKLADALGLSGLQKRILRVLVTNRSKRLIANAIAADVYEGCEDGGPLYASHSVTHAIEKLRRKLAPFGYAVDGLQGTGGGYILTPISLPRTASTTLSTEQREVA